MEKKEIPEKRCPEFWGKTLQGRLSLRRDRERKAILRTESGVPKKI